MELGICQWFHYKDYAVVDRTIETLEELGIDHLRTGLSWADFVRDDGKRWYDWQMDRLEQSGLETMLSVSFTPPSISRGGRSNTPPKRLGDYADFIDQVMSEYGDAFETLEVWNEPNGDIYWSKEHDPDYRLFAEMVVPAAKRARKYAKPVVLGGMALLDHDFLDSMRHLGVLEHVDIVGVHAFPMMWSPHATDWDHPSHWYGWEHRIDKTKEWSGKYQVWVTETGLSTYSDHKKETCRYTLQKKMLESALGAPSERLYWYSLFDLPPERPSVAELHRSPEASEHHMGLFRHDPSGRYRTQGFEKPAVELLQALTIPKT